MGNCMFNPEFSSNAVEAKNKKKTEPTREAAEIKGVEEAAITNSQVSSSKKQTSRGKNVRLSFKVGENGVKSKGKGKGGGGGVRIRIVVTQEELSQILSNKYTSVEQFLRSSRSRTKSVSISRVCSNWRPALDSIPEDI